MSQTLHQTCYEGLLVLTEKGLPGIDRVGGGGGPVTEGKDGGGCCCTIFSLSKACPPDDSALHYPQAVTVDDSADAPSMVLAIYVVRRFHGGFMR